MIDRYILGLNKISMFTMIYLNLTNQILKCPVNAKKKQIQNAIRFMYNVTKLNLFADEPVGQDGNSVSVREFII